MSINTNIEILVKKLYLIFLLAFICTHNLLHSQINTDRVTIIGRNALYYEDYVLAIQYFNQVIGAKPFLAEPYYFRAIAKYYLNDYKGAQDDCSEAISRNPYMTRAYQLRGETYQRQEHSNEALADYNYVLKNNPRDLFSGINSSITYLDLEDKDSALQRINEVVEFAPNNPQVYMVRGSIELAKGDTIQTLNDLNKAVTLDKYLSRAYAMRGMVNYMRNENDSAIIDMNHAIELDPNIYDYYINRGLVLYASNNFRGAMKDYDFVVEKEPDNILAHFNRGLLRSQVGDNNNAIEDFNYVLQQQPNNYMALYNRAILNNEIGDYNQAIDDISKIIERYPDKISVYKARGVFYRNAKQENLATRDFNKASTLESQALADKDKQVAKDYDVKYNTKDTDDIDKFQLLVMSESKNVQESKYKNEKRGNVQNQAANIEPQDKFVLSYYANFDEYKTSIYYSKDIDALNNTHILPAIIKLTNDEIALDEGQIKQHFESINNLSQQISQQPQNYHLYFARAIDYVLVQDYTSADADLTKAIDLKNNFIPALFELAVVKTKETELSKYDQEEESKNTLTYKAQPINNKNKQQGSVASTKEPVSAISLADKQKNNIESVVKLYNAIITINPNFAYSYYNRGLLNYSIGDYRNAINDFTSAIDNNGQLYEAYFNRALAYLQLKMNEEGLNDMRKAGEGGIIEAYPIIKRMTE